MTVHDGELLSGAEAIVAALEAEEAEGIFGYPGGQVLDIFDALYRSPHLHCILVRHEQGAVHAADGYARSTGRPGVVVVTSGPGATNTVTGIATAYMDSIPMVVITGQVDTAVIGTDAFQESDITGITLPIVKHSYLVKDVMELPRVMKEAFHIATTGRPGPVLVDVPANVARQHLLFHYPDSIQMATYRPTYKGHGRQVKQAAQLISESRCPVLYTGGGIISSGAEPELRELAETMEIPVVTTLMGRGCLPTGHRLEFGMSGMHGMEYANRLIMASDLVIAVGVRFADRVTGRIERFAPGAKVIHIDIDPAEIGKNREPDVPIVGDARLVLDALLVELRRMGTAQDHTGWVASCEELRRTHPLSREHSDTHIVPSEFMVELARALDGRDAVLVTDVGQHQMWAAQYLPISDGRSFLSSGGLGTMGFGLPAAIGAQVAHPDRLVVCVTGDGGFQMDEQEMATAAVGAFPVKVIIVDNACLGMVREYQQFFYEGRYASSLLADLPDFPILAKAYGWWGKRVDVPGEVAVALDDLLSCEGPGLLDVRIPRSELVLPLVMPGGALDELVGPERIHDDDSAVLQAEGE